MYRKTNRCIAAAVAGALFAFPLFACSSDPSWKISRTDDFVDVHTSEQASYINSSNYETVYADGKKELSRPAPLHLTFSYGDCKDYTVELSRDDDFTDSAVYHTEKGAIDIYNLYVGSAYAWRVTAKLADGKKSVSKTSYFITMDKAPRNIYVGGITNVRDLGGWTTGDGHVKQGMIYRCGRLNKSWTNDVEIEITQGGISTMRDELGIKSEIDLRRPDDLTPADKPAETGGITESPLGSDVNYYNIPMDMDVQGNVMKGNADGIKEFFEILGDRDNYPMIFHCDIGTDRTGMCAFFINGLLGVSLDDLYRDYLFSNFGKIGVKRIPANIAQKYVNTLNSYNGDTLAQKIRNYLVTEIGVSASDIDTMCEMMTAAE